MGRDLALIIPEIAVLLTAVGALIAEMLRQPRISLIIAVIGLVVGTGLTLRRASLRANARQVNTLRPHVVEMSKRYPTLDLPVELVHGDTDDTVPLDIHSQPLSALLPDANLTVLPGIGHMPHHVAPEAVTAAIDRAARRAGVR